MSSYFDYLKAAFLHPVNWMGAGLLGLIALVTFNPLFFFLLAGWEATWVGGAPMAPAFRNSVDAAHKEKTITLQSKDEEQTLATLSPAVRQQYQKLHSIAASIRTNYTKGTAPSAMFLEQITARTDELLQRYLELLKARERFAALDAGNTQSIIRDKLTELDAEIVAADDKLAEIKTRQRGILQQRLEQAQKAEKEFQLLEAQLETIEELVQLLNSQAVTISKPEEISSQFDSIISEIEVTESTMSELQSSAGALFDKELEQSIQQKRIDS